ncbi:glycosyltransferase, partial [Patescibacteria group bacterium]|nr:glycosyltransferase [Patescibacteria group bacterium]
MNKAIVIIPTYNERDNIEPTISRVFDNFYQIKNWEMHILVVDDTSPDKTYEVV